MKRFAIHRGLLEVDAGNGVTFHLAFLPGWLTLIGVPGHQNFKLPTQDAIEVEYYRLVDMFPTKESLAASAELFREGHTNKDRFLASVEKLLDARKISEGQRNQLRTFIRTCDCAPSIIRKKLSVIGFASLEIDFEDPDPRLESTVDAMWGVILSMREVYEAPDQEKAKEDTDVAEKPKKKSKKSKA